MRRIILLLALASLMGCQSTSPICPRTSCRMILPVSDTTVLYMATTGDDGNPGTEAAPLATLAGVQALLERDAVASDVIVRIESGGGTYAGQTVVWEYTIEGKSITFTSWPENVHAVFSGGHMAGLFFAEIATPSRATNFTFQNLDVLDYSEGAFYFTGDDANPDAWTGSNVWKNCQFTHIGNYWNSLAPLCYGVIDLKRSTDCSITDCIFTDCANYSENLTIIGIYLAHDASRNRIANNLFNLVKGDAIRIRDFSNDNEVCDNYFNQSGWEAAITTWYCNPRLTRCSAFECPSWGTLIHDNVMHGDYRCISHPIYKDLMEADRDGCQMPRNYTVKDGRGFGDGMNYAVWGNTVTNCR